MPIDVVLTTNGLYIDGEIGDNIETLKKQLTLTYTSSIGDKKYTINRKLFQKKGPITFFSRFSGVSNMLRALNYEVNFVNRLPEIAPQKLSVSHLQSQNDKPPLVLYNNQKVVHDYILNSIFNEERRLRGVASCVLELPTGAGKTYTAGGIIKTLNSRFITNFGRAINVLIAVPNKIILAEWRKMFHNFDLFDGFDIIIGEYSSIKKKDGNIVIITAKSLIKAKLFDMKYWEYLRKFDFVIYDEIHNYATDSYQEVFWRTCTHYNLGLTATPDERLDQMDELYIKHIGRLIKSSDIPGYEQQAPIPWKGEVIIVKYYGPIQYTHDIKNAEGWTAVQPMQKQFASDPYRNNLIFKFSNQLLERHKNTFLFGEHRDFLDLIAAKLNEIAGKIICGVLKGGVKESEVAEIIKLPIIGITYCYGKEGVSIPKMTAIMFVQSRKNKMNQIIGRILRAGGNPEETREIYDIVDQRTSLKSQLQTRKEIYRQKNFAIREIKVKYQEFQF